MCKALIMPQPYQNSRCDAQLGCRGYGVWWIGAADSPQHTRLKICDEGARHMIEHLPDELLSAVGALVLRHVTGGTEWGAALVSKIADAISDEPASEPEALVGVTERWSKTEETTITTETPNGPEVLHATCACGKAYQGETAAASLAGHQRQCKVFKEQKAGG